MQLTCCAAGDLLASGKWCRLQHSKVNIIGAITKLISFSLAAVGGASLAGPLIQEGIGAHCLPLYIGTPASLSATAPWPVSLPQRRLSAVATPRRPGQQQLPDGSSPQRHSRQQLRHGVPASNKPHLAERSTPVWLAIWRIWAGFANSQLRRATFRSTYLYICVHPHCCTLGCCSDRRKSVSPSAPIAYATSVSPPDEVAAWPGRRRLVLDIAGA